MTTRQTTPPLTIERFQPRTTRKSWGEEILVAHQPDAAGRLCGGYTGKLLKRSATGQRGGLQYHAVKDESFYLLDGEVWVYYVESTGPLLLQGQAWVQYVEYTGQLHRIHMTPGMSFHVPPGVPHSVETITDSIMFEASTPIFDDRVRVEEQYAAEMEALGASPAAPPEAAL